MRRIAAIVVCGAALAGCSEYDYREITMTETFDQVAEPAAADVLFVVDNSSSMSEEQALLQSNFASFVELIRESFANFQLGVTTTDVIAPDAGLLRGGVLTPDTPDLVGAATHAFAVGTHGSRDERGLEAAAMALDGRNPGFHRDGTRLNIVVFSDEDDHSDGTVEDWLYQYEDVAGHGNFAVHAIVGDLPEGCASGSSAADPGPRYLAASVHTDGWRDSICADDYTGILTHVGLDVVGLIDTFVLANYPAPDTIQVLVDGASVTHAAIDGWNYDPGPNAIVFNGAAVPEPGSHIVVSYKQLGATDSGG